MLRYGQAPPNDSVAFFGALGVFPLGDVRQLLELHLAAFFSPPPHPLLNRGFVDGVAPKDLVALEELDATFSSLALRHTLRLRLCCR